MAEKRKQPSPPPGFVLEEPTPTEEVSAPAQKAVGYHGLGGPVRPISELPSVLAGVAHGLGIPIPTGLPKFTGASAGEIWGGIRDTPIYRGTSEEAFSAARPTGMAIGLTAGAGAVVSGVRKVISVGRAMRAAASARRAVSSAAPGAERVVTTIEAVKAERQAEQAAAKVFGGTPRRDILGAAGEQQSLISRTPTPTNTPFAPAAWGGAQGDILGGQLAPETLKIIPTDMVELVKSIKTAAISEKERNDAYRGLMRAFGLDVRGGFRVPAPDEITALSKVFGEGWAERIKQLAATKDIKKVPTVAETVGGTARAMLSSADLSAPLRQGVFLAPRFPKEFARANATMIEAALNENSYLGIAENLMKNPMFDLMNKGDLALPVFEKVGTGREEAYAASQLAEKFVPWIRPSSRAYNGFLSKFRADVFENIVRGLGKPLEQISEAEAKAVANFVNTATGRGNIRNWAQHVNTLQSILFAPRLMMSRLQLINPMWYIRQPAATRKIALQSGAMFYGSIATALGAASAAGARVSVDYRSADFGKIILPFEAKGGISNVVRIVPAIFGVGEQTYEGETRFDVSGGVLPYVRLMGQLFHGTIGRALPGRTGEYFRDTPFAVSSTTGEEQTYRGRTLTPGEIVGRFVVNKLGPTSRALHEYFSEGEYKDKEFSYIKALVESMTPIILQDLFELTNGGEESLGEAIERLIRGESVNRYSFKGNEVAEYLSKKKGKVPPKNISDIVRSIAGGTWEPPPPPPMPQGVQV